MEGYKCVDLFCGAGGFSLGFQRAGFDILAAVDRNESALKTYRHNFEGVHAVSAEIREFDVEMLSNRSVSGVDDIDVVVGGPPCKGFSTAGRMDPDDPRNELVVEYVEAVEQLDPEIVVLENVTGFLNLEDGKYADQLETTLSKKGYIVEEPDVLTAADYGVPQLRKRVILVATKGGNFQLPTPSHRPDEPEDWDRYSPEMEPYVSVEDAIGDLSFLKYGQEASEYKLKPLTDYQRRMRRGSDEIQNHKAPNHGETVRERFQQFDYGQKMNELPEEYQTKKHTMVRWHPREPAPTVTTLPEDFVHYERSRIPTVREIARIQSFPDTFVFKGQRTTGGSQRRHSVPQYTQVGNAVPPKLAKAVGERVKAHLLNRKVTPGT